MRIVSPLWGYDAARAAAEKLELSIVATGIDSIFESEVWARHTYPQHALKWGHRLREHIEVDEENGGRLVIRSELFHAAVPDDDDEGG